MKPPIFLFGSGRCGSTLVQRAINAHADVVMYGEHEGFLGPIANAYHKLTQTADVQRYIFGAEALPASMLHGPITDSEKDICWVNNFSREDVYREHRALVLNLLARDLDLEQIHWGFKEIRYRRGQHILWFLREMFPDCQFVFLVRDPVTTVVSGLLAWEQPASLLTNEKQLATVVENRFQGWTSKCGYLLDYAGQQPEGSYVLRYEDLIADPELHMREIFSRLELDCPQLALKMFDHRVASTRADPARGKLTDFVRQCRQNTSDTDFLQLSASLQYA
jgi:hypothetical protein